MELDPAAVSDAIATLAEPGDFRSEWDAVEAVVDPLVAQYGAEAVLAALAPAGDDPYVAAALFEVCSTSGIRLTQYFSDDAIVSAALTHLLGVGQGTASLSTGRWAWSALFQHDCGSLDHFDDEAHLRILFRLIDEAPWDDSVLFMIGDGPLSHAAGNSAVSEEIRRLSDANPKLARAWLLNLTDGGRLPPPR
jgi:hypothetical protein